MVYYDGYLPGVCMITSSSSLRPFSLLLRTLTLVRLENGYGMQSTSLYLWKLENCFIAYRSDIRHSPLIGLSWVYVWFPR